LKSLTWSQFVQAVEDKGVKPNDEIWFIDISFPTRVKVLFDGTKGVQITDAAL
jgi:hypothetical protein